MPRSIEYITEVAGGKDAILAEAAQDPKIAKKRKPDQDQVAMAVLKVVEKRAIAGAADLVRDELSTFLDAYKQLNDERFMADDPDEWDSGLDDKVELVFQPYNDVLSADFLATATIDAHLEEEGGVERVAMAFGKEVYKQLCWQAGDKDVPGKIKQPMQILASAGILTSHILGYFEDRIVKTSAVAAEPEVDIQQEQREVAALNDLIRQMIAAGVTADTADVEVLANLVDSDDTLSSGAAQQVGLSPDDAVAFQMLSLDMDEEAAVQHIVALLREVEGWQGSTAEPATGDEYDYIGEAPAPVVPPPPPAPSAKSAVGLNDVLVLMQAHGGTGAADAATLVGVSRATFNNYINGKSEWKPDDEAKQRVFDEIERHIQGLMSARALLDGAN